MSDKTTNDTPTTLVVDGDVLVRLTIAEYLRDCGFDVLEASSGDEALTVLRSERAVDVLLCDAVLPGTVDGFALAAWIRENRPGIKTVLTGSVSGAASSAARLCSNDGTVPKPYDPQRVLERIRRLTGRADGRRSR